MDSLPLRSQKPKGLINGWAEDHKEGSLWFEATGELWCEEDLYRVAKSDHLLNPSSHICRVLEVGN